MQVAERETPQNQAYQNRDTKLDTPTIGRHGTLGSRIAVTGLTPLGLATPCWTWTGAHDSDGYARVKVDGQCRYVRREVLRLLGVKLTKVEQVISLCRDHGCVNPQHHIVGTKEQARMFARHGSIGKGELLSAKRHIDDNAGSIAVIADHWNLPPSLLVDAVSRCA